MGTQRKNSKGKVYKQDLSNFEIGTLYRIYINDLRSCRVVAHQKNPLDFEEHLELQVTKIPGKFESEAIFMCTRYIGNGLFEEMVTGKIFTSVEQRTDYNDCDYTVNTLVNYPEVLPILDRIRKYPLIIRPNDIYPFTSGDISIYYRDESQKLISRLLHEASESAKDVFYKSLNEAAFFAYDNYEMEKINQKIKEFENKPLPKI